jgi:hypothetical protein
MLGLLAGCSTLQLHSDTRQKQAETAETAWTAVDLKPVFAQERENQAKLLAAEIDGWNASLDRKHAIETRQLGDLPLGQYAARFDAELGSLAGVPPRPNPPAAPTAARVEAIAAVRAANAALISEAASKARLARALSFLQGAGAPNFTCEQLRDKSIVDAWKEKDPGASKAYASMLSSAGDHCKKIDTARATYNESLARLPASSRLGALLEAWEKDQKQLLDLQADVDAKRRLLNIVQKAYDNEVAKTQGTSSTDAIKQRASDVKDALDTLAGTAGVFGVELASQERIKRIDDFLASLGKGEALSTDGASKLELGLSMLPKVLDDSRQIDLASKQRGVAPLLLQRDLEQAKLSAASTLASRRRQDAELLGALLEASVRQASTYADAASSLERVDLKRANAERDLLSDGLQKLNPANQQAERQELLRGAMQYLDAYTRQGKAIKTIELRRLALLYDTAVDTAESNAAVWQTLLATTVTQSSEYAKLGIDVKKDAKDIAGLLGLFYIGHGTNTK